MLFCLLYWRPVSYPCQNLKSLSFVWTSSHQLAHSKVKTRLPIFCLSLLQILFLIALHNPVPPPRRPPIPPSLHPSLRAVTPRSHLGSGSCGCLPRAHIQAHSLLLADSFCITSLRYGLPYPSVQLKLLSRLSAFHISITVKSFSLLGKCSLIQRFLLHLPAQPLPYPPTTA